MFFIIGSNTTEAHPVAATFLKQAVQDGAVATRMETP
jgi:formate dehydrogenase major subunit